MSGDQGVAMMRFHCTWVAIDTQAPVHNPEGKPSSGNLNLLPTGHEGHVYDLLRAMIMTDTCNHAH